MTVRAEAGPPAVLHLAAGVLAASLAVLGRAIRARPPNAAGLTDRQLADIGLTRADLPDHRGWRR